MVAGKVVGSIVSTRKNDKLIGNKFMIVEDRKSTRLNS
ncbi:MAG: ethanolamine utilization protein EutN, partial [Tyzzerella sp.]|nr:ethanolamine utilization protein EutN [Tyzzerella sp.]